LLFGPPCILVVPMNVNGLRTLLSNFGVRRSDSDVLVAVAPNLVYFIIRPIRKTALPPFKCTVTLCVFVVLFYFVSGMTLLAL